MIYVCKPYTERTAKKEQTDNKIKMIALFFNIFNVNALCQYKILNLLY